MKLGHVGTKTRSLGQILGKPCLHSKRHSFDPKYMQVCQRVSHQNRISLKLGHVKLKTRLLGQILENIVYTLEGTVLNQS